MAQEQSAMIARDYVRTDGRVLEHPNGRDAAYLWPFGMLLLSEAARLRSDDDGGKRIDRLLTEMEAYRAADAYSASRGDDDVYYDDNAWVARALLEAPGKHPSWRGIAERILRFNMAAQDSKLGGGLYWRVKPKESKNTCTNAPTLLGLILLGKPADGLMKWISCLEDPADGLFWDNIRLDGTIEKTKWSYNTGVMIRAFLAATSGPGPLRRRAVRAGASAADYWLTSEGAIKCDASFACHLVDAWLDLARVDESRPWREYAERAALYAWTHLRDEQGHSSKRWERVDGGPSLLADASLARAMWRLAVK